MARITDDDVTAICDVDTTITLTPFIEVANELVTELCSDSDYTDARLAKIEAWLAAHFYQIRDQAVAAEKAGPVSQNYQYKVDKGLDQTKYGQMAMLIDTAGSLAGLNQRIQDGEAASIGISWMGEDYDSEDDD